MRAFPTLAAACLTAATARAQTPAPPATLPITGTVYDSLAGRPLAGAVVQMIDSAVRTRALTAVTDSAGTYRLPAVPAGRYLAGFIHPSLDLLGIEPPMLLVEVLADSAARLDFALPPSPRVRTTWCPARSDSNGVLLGLVRDAESGELVTGGQVVVTWQELVIGDGGGVRVERRRVPAPVQPGGAYALCSLPTDGPLVVGAEVPGHLGGLIEIAVPARGTLRRDLLVGDSTVVAVVPDTAARAVTAGSSAPSLLRGRASLAGTVLRPDGRPAPGARVLVVGTAARAVTSAAGTFQLDALPSGTHTLDVRALGFAPASHPVDLSSRRAATLTVRLLPTPPVLSSVRVFGRPSRGRDVTGFLARRDRGLGRYLTASAIERYFRLTDALRLLPGVRVADQAFGQAAVRLRDGCAPAVYMDGIELFGGADDLDVLARPMDVLGVELYRGPETPAQFAGRGGGSCGSLVVWTKR